MRVKLLIISIFVFSCIPVLADVRLYLYPRCEFEGQSLKIENIAWVEGEQESVELVKKIILSDKIWKDGYVDRREIDSILKNEQIGLYSVIGNSVRVIKAVGVRAEKEKLEKLADHSVKRGDQVTVLVSSRKITLKTHGSVSKEAFPGDEVSVQLDKKRTVHGILKEDKIVEVKI
jgi:hypothetical protein